MMMLDSSSEDEKGGSQSTITIDESTLLSPERPVRSRRRVKPAAAASLDTSPPKFGGDKWSTHAQFSHNRAQDSQHDWKTGRNSIAGTIQQLAPPLSLSPDAISKVFGPTALPLETLVRATDDDPISVGAHACKRPSVYKPAVSHALCRTHLPYR